MLAAIPVLMFTELNRKDTRNNEQKEELMQSGSSNEKQSTVIAFSPMLRMES
jgi:hypothetical protein